jgi:hypothetical protein
MQAVRSEGLKHAGRIHYGLVEPSDHTVARQEVYERLTLEDTLRNPDGSLKDFLFSV